MPAVRRAQLWKNDTLPENGALAEFGRIFIDLLQVLVAAPEVEATLAPQSVVVAADGAAALQLQGGSTANAESITPQLPPLAQEVSIEVPVVPEVLEEVVSHASRLAEAAVAFLGQWGGALGLETVRDRAVILELVAADAARRHALRTAVDLRRRALRLREEHLPSLFRRSDPPAGAIVILIVISLFRVV